MGGQEPGEAQGGKPRRKKGGSSSRRPRRGDRGGSHGAGGWRKRAEGEEKRRDDEVTEVASKSVNELGSGKAEMEQKEVSMLVKEKWRYNYSCDVSWLAMVFHIPVKLMCRIINGRGVIIR